MEVVKLLRPGRLNFNDLCTLSRFSNSAKDVGVLLPRTSRNSKVGQITLLSNPCWFCTCSERIWPNCFGRRWKGGMRHSVERAQNAAITSNINERSCVLRRTQLQLLLYLS
jgi:hypothetical protein